MDVEGFPNFENIVELDLNGSREFSFSLLKTVKNNLKNAIQEDKLNDLS